MIKKVKATFQKEIVNETFQKEISKEKGWRTILFPKMIRVPSSWRMLIKIEDKTGIYSFVEREVWENYEKNPDIPIEISYYTITESYYLFSNNVYYVKNEFFDTMDDLKNLILAYEIKLKKKLERAKTTVSRQTIHNNRSHIPDDVKEFVWRRDGGKCVKCGSQYHLEYDHIIALNKGGSNTARNIQILCESCNRQKSDDIS